ncbi:hypothetical protein ACFE04_023722 [Oxalis oulophora]
MARSTNSNKKGNKKDTNLVIKILKTPYRLLIKGRDLYVNSMTQCSGQVYTTSTGLGAEAMPRSYSVNSTRSVTSDDDFAELVRAASVRRLETELLSKQLHEMPTTFPRSRTVAIGRIEEVDESEFSYEYPRSKSVAVGPKRITAVF